MGNSIAIPSFSPSQLRTIKQTVAKDTNQEEFDLFMEACRSYGLDPFRKQIHAAVYSKDDPKRRKMSIIVSRDGQRVMAHRCGDYRPATEPATITYDQDLKSPTNPLGIVSARVTLFKQDRNGEWFPVAGEAYWDEFAPVKDEWAFDQQAGKRQPTGNKTLDATGQWAKMPRLMIAKCAESQALRAGWPEQFGNIYSEEEMDRLAAESSASEELREYERAEREARIGGPALMMVFDDTATLTRVPVGAAHDRVAEFLDAAEPEDVHKFEVRNRETLKELWAHDKAAALDLKKRIEAKTARLGSADEGEAA